MEITLLMWWCGKCWWHFAESPSKECLLSCRVVMEILFLSRAAFEVHLRALHNFCCYCKFFSCNCLVIELYGSWTSKACLRIECKLCLFDNYLEPKRTLNGIVSKMQETNQWRVLISTALRAHVHLGLSKWLRLKMLAHSHSYSGQ